MRHVKRIILHCTATEPDQDIGVAEVRRWHTSEPLNWTDIGYHYLIRLDGKIERGRPVNLIGAHTKGHNHDSVGIAYAGGIKHGDPFDTMNACQERCLLDLIFALRLVFGDIPVRGHNEYSTKACPSFIVNDKFKNLNTWIS